MVRFGAGGGFNYVGDRSANPGNTVTLSYRNDKFSRIKPGNRTRLEEAVAGKRLKIANR